MFEEFDDPCNRYAKLMDSRGFYLSFTNGDKTSLHYHHNVEPVACTISIHKDLREMKRDTFEITSLIWFFECRSGKCGSIEDEKHFQLFFRNMANMCRVMSKFKYIFDPKIDPITESEIDPTTCLFCDREGKDES